ncbi:MAG: DUF4038 domain-containing protein [Gammaproteobacteria bacterium]|nr:DUF4038 domain-containing protein [Gammaproteobacteria bacterium]MYJ73877.1 DUF4038 domain-containing protein [Gammaproteobacteria bacterium]
MKRLTLAAGWAVCAWAGAFDGPLKVSSNGRYLTFQSGEPFYYVADTPWQLLASLDIDATKEYIDVRAAQGFTALQLVATPWSFDDTAAHWDFEGETGQARVNAQGEAPFFDREGKPPKDTADVRFDRPNDAYWRHVDNVLDYLAGKGLAAYFIPLWASNFSRHFSEADHYHIGKTLGERYRTQPNLVWALGGDEARVSVAKYRRLYQGLRDAGITQLVTMHPRAGRSSADHLHEELDFHSIQERGDVASMVRRLETDYRRAPAKPTFLCETWYEHDRDGGVFRIHKTGTSAAFRAHYWAARLHGGFGEGYGGWTTWLNLDHWRTDIGRPGAVAIATHMRDILGTTDWHNLVPDRENAVFGAHEHVHAAISGATKIAVAYFESDVAVTIDPQWFGEVAGMVWYDPADGRMLGVQPLHGEPSARRPPATGAGGDTVVTIRPLRHIKGFDYSVDDPASLPAPEPEVPPAVGRGRAH